MLDSKSLRVDRGTIRQQTELLLDHLELTVLPLLLHTHRAQVASRMLSQLCRVKSLVGKNQNLWIVLLVTIDQLPEVNWSCDVHRVGVVDPHPIQIFKVSDTVKGGVLFDIAKEAHSLQPTVPEGFISSQHQLILPEVV